MATTRLLTPDDVRRALAVLRMRANRALDPLFAGIVDFVERIILRHARTGPDGVPRLDRVGEMLATTELRGLLTGIRGDVVTAIGHAIAAAERLAIEQAARIGIAAGSVVRDLAGLFVRVDGLVGNALGRVMGQVSRVLTRAAEMGQDAREAGVRLRKYLSPAYAPYRLPDGRLVRTDVPGALTDWPAASGSGVDAVRLIADHEVTQAHRNGIIAATSDGRHATQWVLSSGHERGDECDDLANADSGFGPGIYLPGEVPPTPHIRCACSLMPIVLTGRTAA